jgi:class 3 adenylate cyclase/tetratricopeptide (TPR) repeat protein
MEPDPAQAPGGTLTIMFEDVEGSTAFAAAHGDAAWGEVQRTHDRLIRDEVERRNASDVVFLGDGYLVAFADPADALDAAVAIERAVSVGAPSDVGQPLRVRIGLHTGEVSRDDRGNLVGAAVHAASRITGKAAGGQIFVSQVVRDGANTSRAFTDRGLFWLKGFPERWRLHELAWTDGVPAPHAASHLAGRESELADLRRLREQAESGNGRLALIGGEPGVGKTTLAQEVMAEASARGALSVAGHCYQMEAPPYIPFVEALEACAEILTPDDVRTVFASGAEEVAKMWPGLRRLIPDLPQPQQLPPEQARRYLFTCLAEAFDRLSRLRPLVMLLDDLQWADPSTVLLLQHLAQRLGQVPILLLGTYRDIEVGPGLPFGDALETLIRQPRVARLGLKRLPREAVADVITRLADRDPPTRLVDLVFSETEGNPFFVEEVFHHLAEEGKLFDEHGDWRGDVAIDESEVPQGVRLLLGRRLARLSAPTRTALTTAAIAGRGVGIKLLQRLDVPNLFDALDEAERANLITFAPHGSDTAVHFSHELIRQTLIGELSSLQRQRLHARIAQELEVMLQGQDPREYAADLCYHLLQAGPLADPAKTVRMLRLAGQRDLAAAAFEEALRRFEQALALKPEDARECADLEFGLGSALRSLGRWDEAVQRWHQAIDGYRALGDAEAAGRVSWYAVEQLAWIARWEEALVAAGEGLAALGDVVNADRVRLMGNAALMFSAGAYGEAAEQMFAEAESMAHQLNDPPLLGHLVALEAIHNYFAGQPRRSVELGLRAAELLRAAGDAWNLASGLSFVALNAAVMLDFERVHSAAAEATELADRYGHLPARWVAHRANWIEAQLGGLEEFERFIERDVELIRGLPWTAGTSVFSSVAAFRRGEWSDAIRHLEEAIELEVSEALRPGDVGMLMMTLAYAGERDRALKLYEDEADALEQLRVPNQSDETSSRGAAPLLGTVVEALWALGERERAAAYYEACVRIEPDTGQVVRTWDARLLETVLAIAAAAGEQWSRAEEHFERSLTLADGLPHAVEAAEVRRLFGEVLLLRGAPADGDRAASLLSDAMARYRELGMPEHERIANELLAGRDGGG